MKKYNIALIGCGMISKSHFDAIAALENAELKAIAEVLPQRAETVGREHRCAWYTDARTMLENEPDIDVCLICLPTYLHAEHIALCASYGKAVLCEKPFTLTVEDAELTAHTIEKAGIPYMTAQVVRFWTGYTKIKEMLDNGEFGELYLSYFSRCSERQYWGNDWLFDPKRGGGAMFDMMVHDVDYMNSLFGPAKQVYTLAAKDETGCYDNVFASITFENGHKAIAETAFNMHTGYPFTMYAKIMGSKAAAELTYRAGYDINQRDGAFAELKIFREGQPFEIISLEQYDAYRAEIAYFLECLDRGVKPAVVTAEDSVEVIRTVNAIRRSADTGSIVELRR